MRSAHATSLVPPTPLRPYPERRGSWLGALVKLVLVLVVIAAIAEGALHYRDGGAFPYLNVYAPDAERGVRLIPGARQKLALPGNPLTTVRINRDGHRGAELPPASTDDVLVVGDSQAFGLGVEDDQTFAAMLGRTLGKTVVNAGVPTYGPPEYRAVITAQLARRRPQTVVLAINLASDAAEAQRADRDRHVVVDGQAVPREAAPAEITEFPGRDLVYRHSHLLLALRRWRLPDELGDRGLASERAWKDVAATARPAAPDASKSQGTAEGPLVDQLRGIHQLVHGAGARLAVVVLPIDVQVSADEWKKYGAAPVDMEPSKAIAAELVALCGSLGVPVLDATPALAAAEPGAFLDKDPHMAAKGHAAVAAALARVLTEPPASPPPASPPPASPPPASPPPASPPPASPPPAAPPPAATAPAATAP